MELKPPELELELELKPSGVGVGAGVETPGVGVETSLLFDISLHFPAKSY